MRDQLKKLIIVLIPTVIVAVAGSMITQPAVESWYQHINKPDFVPPNEVFPVVWTVLYLMMTIAAFIVYRSKAPQYLIQPALFMYFVQLGFNLLWSYLFFYKGQFGYAFIEIVILWLMIFYTIVRFGKVSKTAAWMLVPYLLWVGFATYLTYSIYKMN